MRYRMEGASILTLNAQGDQFENGQLTWEDGTIVSVGPIDSDLQPVDQVIHVSHGYILPGLLNGHNHAAMALFRGVADDSPLNEWLTQYIFPMEAKLSPEDIYIGTLLACSEMIHSGTVGFVDMYFAVEQVAKAVVQSGLRGWIARGITGDRSSGNGALEDGLGFAERWGGHRLITPMLGPHAPYTLSPEMARTIGEAAQANHLGIHIHLAESLKEVDDLKALGLSPVSWAKSTGLLETWAVIAHGVHLSDEDIAVLQHVIGGIIACPISNAKLGNGIMPYPLLRKAGVAVGLGTDGAASTNTLDMFLEMKAMAWFQKLREGRPDQFRALDALLMATQGTAKVLAHAGGVLAVGCPADFIMVEARSAHMTPEQDVIANLVYAASGHDVRYTVVDGQILMAEGMISVFDEREVMAEATLRAQHLIG